MLLVFFTGCKTGYYGYVIDGKTYLPIMGVMIKDKWSSSTDVITDTTGFFRLEESQSGELIFYKQGYLADTIRVFQTQNGEHVRQYFKGDTISLQPDL